ncbi:hypothetical protein UFOVP650_9 [uncultured Caudovirales phage]|uniref:Uncharacterized protein n=1 Tax=uncultured Caudovirales phage TaxID=2100421 RepID=A0A6J5NAK8_9CAUD|nr:hypothetical protein UFOVP650_9 [uncultured Caudovirales phage]
MIKRAVVARFPHGLFSRVRAEAALAVGTAWGLFSPNGPGTRGPVEHPVPEPRREIVARWKPREAGALR